MICKACYSQIPDDAKLCPNCNASVEPVAEPVVDTPETYGDSQPTKKTFWKTGKASGFGVFITILLSVCLFFTSFVTLFIFNVKSTISAKGIANIVEDLFEEVSVTEIMESTEIKHEIIHIESILEKEYNAKVPPKTMEKILDHSNVKKFFAQKTGEFVADCFEKDYAELIIDGDHIYDLLIENQEVLHNEINTTLTPEEIRDVVNKTMGDKEHVIMTSTIIKGDPSTNTPSEVLPPVVVEILDAIKLCLADTTVIILLLINLLIIFIMIKIHLPKGITATTTPLIIVSILYIIIGTALAPFFLSMIGDFENSAIITKLINNLFQTSTITCIVLLVLSIGALIFKGLKFKKQK